MAEPRIGATLRTALEEKGWSYTRLIAEMRPTSLCSAVTTVQPCPCCERPTTLHHLPARQPSGPGYVARKRKPRPSRVTPTPASVLWNVPRPRSIRRSLTEHHTGLLISTAPIWTGGGASAWCSLHSQQPLSQSCRRRSGPLTRHSCALAPARWLISLPRFCNRGR
jgi:hypothetical protein